MARAAHSFSVGGPAAASLLVNALLIAALLNLGMGHVRRQSEPAAMTVMSLALPKGVEQGEEEGETAAATPAAVSPPALPPVPTSLPTPQPSPAVAPLPSNIALPMPVQPAAQPESATPVAAQPNRQALSPASPPARRGAIDGLDVKAASGTSRSYAAKVRSWLYAHKIYPRRARMRREEGRVQVRFVLDRTGMLLEGAVVQRSGNATLDEEAEAMMRRASPYPRAPAELVGDRIEFTAPIEFMLSA